jgi:hypothetical protein
MRFQMNTKPYHQEKFNKLQILDQVLKPLDDVIFNNITGTLQTATQQNITFGGITGSLAGQKVHL